MRLPCKVTMYTRKAIEFSVCLCCHEAATGVGVKGDCKPNMVALICHKNSVSPVDERQPLLILCYNV